MKIPRGFELKRKIETYSETETRIVEQIKKFWCEKTQQIEGYTPIGIYNGVGLEHLGWTGREIEKIRKRNKVMDTKLEEILLLACELTSDGIKSKIAPTSDHYALARALISLSDQGRNVTDFVVGNLRMGRDGGLITYEVVAVGYKPLP